MISFARFKFDFCFFFLWRITTNIDFEIRILCISCTEWDNYTKGRENDLQFSCISSARNVRLSENLSLNKTNEDWIKQKNGSKMHKIDISCVYSAIPFVFNEFAFVILHLEFILRVFFTLSLSRMPPKTIRITHRNGWKYSAKRTE